MYLSIDKIILKFLWKFKVPKMPKISLKKNKCGGIPLSDFKTNFKSSVVMTVWYLHNNEQ